MQLTHIELQAYPNSADSRFVSSKCYEHYVMQNMQIIKCNLFLINGVKSSYLDESINVHQSLNTKKKLKNPIDFRVFQFLELPLIAKGAVGSLLNFSIKFSIYN